MENIQKKKRKNYGYELRQFGVTGKHIGFNYTVRAMKLIWENENTMLNVDKNIYRVIALSTGCEGPAVSSAIGTLAEAVWDREKDRLLAFNPSLMARPSNTELFEILLQHLNDPQMYKR